MTVPHNLQRFVNAQSDTFETAMSELRTGRKQSHWMWFIFPQLAGLGRSPTAQFYGIGSRAEADDYLTHSILGPRLRQSAEALLPWAGKRNADDILGPIDAMKLKSSMTLFEAVSGEPLFGRVLDAFYSGVRDDQTLALLNGTD